MRLSNLWLRPVVTAVLFPIVLITIMWGVDVYAQWRSERLVAVTRQQAVALSWSQCFSKPPPGFPAAKWTYAHIGSTGWEIEADQTYIGHLLGSRPLAWAWVPTQGPQVLLDCRFIGEAF